MINDPPQIIYIALINFFGLFSKEPILCIYNFKKWYKEEWLNRDEDLHIKKLGISHQNGYTIFASPSKMQVETWISGAQAILKQLQEFSTNNTGCKNCNRDILVGSGLCIFCIANEKETGSSYCKSCGFVILHSKTNPETVDCNKCRGSGLSVQSLKCSDCQGSGRSWPCQNCQQNFGTDPSDTLVEHET